MLLQKGTAAEMVRLFSVGHTAVDRYKHSFATFDPEALTLIYTTALDLLPPPSLPQPVVRPTCFAAANARFGAPVGNLDKQGMYTRGWEEARVLRHEEHFSVQRPTRKRRGTLRRLTSG